MRAGVKDMHELGGNIHKAVIKVSWRLNRYKANWVK